MPLQQTKEQTSKTSKHTFEFTYNYFHCHLLTEERHSLYTNHRWKGIILSVWTLDVFEGKIVITVIKLEFVCQTSHYYFFKSVNVLFFLVCSQINRCQIVTDTCKKMFRILFGSLLNHLHCYTNKNIWWSLSL